MKKDHVLYVAKMGPGSFKFGITKNVKLRMNNLVTTGYKPVLIGETTKKCSKTDAYLLEQSIKNVVQRNSGLAGEYCTADQVSWVIKTIKKELGFKFYNDINIKVDEPVVFKVGEIVTLRVTNSAIEYALSVCTDESSTSACVLAAASLLQGLARPDVQATRTKFSKDGKRYTCLNSLEAYQILMQFDNPKLRPKIKPIDVKLEVVKVEDIAVRNYSQPDLSKRGTKRKKSAPRRTRGRDKGSVKYFVNAGGAQ